MKLKSAIIGARSSRLLQYAGFLGLLSQSTKKAGGPLKPPSPGQRVDAYYAPLFLTPVRRLQSTRKSY
jgi:hypothetical protein